MAEAVIVAATRSPIGRAGKGSLVEMRGDDMAEQMVRAALACVPELPVGRIDELILGSGSPAGETGYNVARVVAVLSGLHLVPGTTVHRYCASSAQAIRMAFHAIKAGEGHAFVVGGVETVSRYGVGAGDNAPKSKNPRFREARSCASEVASSGAPWTDPSQRGELPDIYLQMGLTAENVATLESVSRHDQDEFAVLSQERAGKAQAAGFWERDITPLTLADGTVVTKDDGPRPGTTYEALARLAPVFREGGSVTAGNSCPLNDGAAALVIVSDALAAEVGLVPLARIVSTGVTALSPEIMGLGPIAASEQALARAGMAISDMDLVEINEAFAAQVIPCARKLGIEADRLNVNGGAIALGHPFGMTGARIATTLIHSMKDRDVQFGLETMCVAGGQGMALVLERLS